MAKLSPLLILQARAEARAMLCAAGEFDLFDALEPLHAFAAASGLLDKPGTGAVAAIIRSAFTEVAGP